MGLMEAEEGGQQLYSIIIGSPHLGEGTSKSDMMTIMITGSNVTIEALPLHFQFQTSAKSAEIHNLRNDLI